MVLFVCLYKIIIIIKINHEILTKFLMNNVCVGVPKCDLINKMLSFTEIILQIQNVFIHWW